MKLSKVAAAVAALLATDAKPTEAQIMAACIAADKKGKDEAGLGPVELEKKAADEKKEADAAADAAAEFYGNAKDEWEKMDDKAKDKARDEFKAKAEDEDDLEVNGDADVQPKKSAGGNSGNGEGAQPAKDKKGMDAAVKIALDARDALHAARREVETVLGVVAYDSASEVYKAALTKLGVDTKGVHESAFATLFRMKRDAVTAATPVIASDAAVIQGMAGAIKGYTRLP